MRLSMLFFALATSLGCLLPVVDAQKNLPLEEWCATRVDDYTCHGSVGCGVADPTASCNDINANIVGFSQGCPLVLLEALDAGRVVYDGVAAERCRQRARSTCDPTVAAWDCAGLLVGTMGVNSACRQTAECLEGLWCDDGATCPGACREKRALGESVPDFAACASSATTLLPDGGLACTTPGRAGEPCTVGLRCSPGLACHDERCVTRIALGSPCQPTDPCAAPGVCTKGQCVAWAPRGSACAPQFFAPNLSLPPCRRGLACRAGSCGDALRAGESCREEPNRCGIGTRCSAADLCAPLGALGAVCSTSTDCDRLFCVEGRCSTGMTEGSSCAAERRCHPSLACAAGRCSSLQCF